MSQRCNFLVNSGNKYKSLSVKLYKTIDDFKEMMKVQNTWQSDEIARMVSKNLKKADLEAPNEEMKIFKKQDFQRATTYTGGRGSLFSNNKGKEPSKIFEEVNDSDSEMIAEKNKVEAIANEDRILNELFRTNVVSI